MNWKKKKLTSILYKSMVLHFVDHVSKSHTSRSVFRLGDIQRKAVKMNGFHISKV